MATPADNLVSLTGNPLIDGLTWGAAWQFGGGAHTLTYSLSLNDNPSGGTWTTALSNAARQALSNWSNVANITFVESGSGTVYSQSSANIALILTGNDLQSDFSGVVGLGIPPSPSYVDTLLAAIGETRSGYPEPEGDVALDNYYTGFSYLDAGGIGLTLMLHEIGHALGLRHTDDASSGRPTFASLGISSLDSQLYTVMSYTDVNGHPLGYDVLGNAATPMPLDILAMQQIYGANTSYHTGDDTYTFYGPSPAMARTIWDAGGNDTLAAGAINQYNHVTLDLREGHYSQSPTISGLSLAIAYGAVIENAIGGAGNDTLIGNGANNRLDGGAGNDSMSGGAGNDVYVVDSAQDAVAEYAGDGSDTVLAYASYVLPAYVEDLTLSGSAGITGQGNGLDNVLTGNGGSSALIGGAGNDILISGAGLTSMQGGIGNDSYYINNSVVIPGTGWGYVGQAGDYISQGQTVSYQANKLQWTVFMHDNTHDGLIDNLTLWGNDVSGNHSMMFSATADQIGQNLVPGSYTDAQRANVGISGHAGLDFSTDSRGSNQVFGSFVIKDISVDYSGSTPLLLRFSATFEQHSESPNAPALIGSIAYGEPDTTVASTIIELPGEGADQVSSSVSYTLAANVENLTLTGSGAIGGVGNELANVLAGNAADNALDGKAGNDTLGGFAGNDGLDGGAGLDLAQYAGNQAGYTVTKSAGYGYTVTDTNLADGNDGTDTLFAVETLQFANATVSLASRALERVGTPAIWVVIDARHDYNSDGTNDLWWKQINGSAIWVMDGHNTQAPHAIAPGAGWSVTDVTTDYNLDGKADLAWQHTDGGTMVWLNAVDLAAAQGIGHDAGWPLG